MNTFMGLFVEIGPYSVEYKLFLGNRMKKPFSGVVAEGNDKYIKLI